MRRWLAWRPARRRMARRLDVLEWVALGPRHGVAVVRIGSACWVLGVGPDALTPITHWEEPTP